jgi:hypothetical protein
MTSMRWWCIIDSLSYGQQVAGKMEMRNLHRSTSLDFVSRAHVRQDHALRQIFLQSDERAYVVQRISR